MIAGILTMGLGETTQTFTNPTFIGEIRTEITPVDELSLQIETQELSLIIS